MRSPTAVGRSSSRALPALAEQLRDDRTFSSERFRERFRQLRWKSRCRHDRRIHRRSIVAARWATSRWRPCRCWACGPWWRGDRRMARGRGVGTSFGHPRRPSPSSQIRWTLLFERVSCSCCWTWPVLLNLQRLWAMGERGAALLLLPVGFLALGAPVDLRTRQQAIDVFSVSALLLACSAWPPSSGPALTTVRGPRVGRVRLAEQLRPAHRCPRDLCSILPAPGALFQAVPILTTGKGARMAYRCCSPCWRMRGAVLRCTHAHTMAFPGTGRHAVDRFAGGVR